jgi:hypothetical protein
MSMLSLLFALAAVPPVSSHARAAEFACKGNATIMYVRAVKDAGTSGRYTYSFEVNNYSRRTMTIQITLGPDTPTFWAKGLVQTVTISHLGNRYITFGGGMSRTPNIKFIYDAKATGSSIAINKCSG